MGKQAHWSPPRMGTCEFHALEWLSDVEPPAGIVIPPAAWMPASRASGLKLHQVKRLAQRAADGGDPRVEWYREHLARLRRRTPRGPGDPRRVRQADWLRRRGLSWRRVALACGYSEANNGHSVRKAVQRYRQRLACGDTLPKARKAYQRREHGEGWAAIARRVGYASDRAARVMARRYAERAELPWPVREPEGAGISQAPAASSPGSRSSPRECPPIFSGGPSPNCYMWWCR